MDVITIKAGNSLCTVAPAIGGSIASWHCGGQAMLRSAISDNGPLAMASFPLVPFSNRIAHGRFSWAGEVVTLAANTSEVHPIHGVGWMRSWHVDQHSTTALTLSLFHTGDEFWPWPFEAQQHISVAHNKLTVETLVRNLASVAVPAAFGHHPYFDQEGATLQFDAATIWHSGADNLPTHAAVPLGAYDFTSGAIISGRAIDNCYSDITGNAQIRWQGRPYALEITTTLPAAVVYIPRGEAFFCYEPVPHGNNALGNADMVPAMPIVEPGAQYRAMIEFNAY